MVWLSRLSAIYLRTAKGEEEIFKASSKDEAKDWLLAIKTNSKLIDSRTMQGVSHVFRFSLSLSLLSSVCGLYSSDTAAC